jgi:hypothetical protein
MSRRSLSTAACCATRSSVIAAASSAGAELGALQRERYLGRLAVVPPELVTAAHDRWKEATAAAVEAAAVATVD